MRLKTNIKRWYAAIKRSQNLSHHPDLSELSTRELPSNESYYLDDIAEIQVRGLTKNSEHPRWQSIAHYIDKRTSLILVSGEEVLIDHCLSIIQDTILFVRYGSCAANYQRRRIGAGVGIY